MLNFHQCPLSPKTRPHPDPRKKAWNSGVKVGKKKPLTPQQAEQIHKYLRQNENLRNQVLFALGYDSALRSCDIRKLKIGDVLNQDGTVRKRLKMFQKKNKEGVECVISEPTRKLLVAWIKENGGSWNDPLFPGRTKEGTLGLKQHQRLVKQWVSAIGINNSEEYSSHTMRRTKASIVYAISKNLEYVRMILGQKTIAAASYYLGVDNEEALAVSQKISLGTSLKESVSGFFKKRFSRTKYGDQFRIFPTQTTLSSQF